MEWLSTNFEWIITAITLLFSLGIVKAVKNAVKESKNIVKY